MIALRDLSLHIYQYTNTDITRAKLCRSLMCNYNYIQTCYNLIICGKLIVESVICKLSQIKASHAKVQVKLKQISLYPITHILSISLTISLIIYTDQIEKHTSLGVK